MDALELFAGRRSIGTVAERYGYNVFSVDWKRFKKIDLVTDIEFLTPEQIPFIPDYFHASPDCTTYSVAALGIHRDFTEPKTEQAKKADRVTMNTIGLLKHYLKVNPSMKFTIENPRGILRTMPFMKGIDRVTVWYCRYGSKVAKPTDIWSNNIRNLFNPDGWNPRAKCYNGNKNCHHIKAPRGMKTGVQGMNDAETRSVIPEKLCVEIIESIVRVQSLEKIIH